MTTSEPEGHGSESLPDEAASDSTSETQPQPPATRSIDSQPPSTFLSPLRAYLMGAVVVLFLVAFLAGRVFAPALLGWRSGMDFGSDSPKWRRRFSGSSPW